MLNFVLRVIGCCAFAYLLWRIFGAFGLVFSAPLFGVALAKPILEGMSSARRGMRVLAYRNIEGRHYDYQGTPIDVMEDFEHCRWLRVADVRRVIPAFPKDETLGVMLGSGVANFDADKALRVKADVLHEHLAKAATPDSIKFRTWLHRTVLLPERKARERRNQERGPPPRMT